MGAVMVDIPTGLLALILTVITALHLAGYYIFFYINLEKIENYLCDIEMFSLNREFYGDSFFWTQDEGNLRNAGCSRT
jgi:hypothetical protein